MPKHFSWSQMNLWLTNRSAYIDKYFAGKEQFITKEMAFGKEMAEAFEAGNIDAPYLHYKEHKIETDIDGIHCVAIFDSVSEDLSEFYEYKTGKQPWTQDRADNHGQLWFYAVLVRELTGKMPQASIVWYETMSDEIITLTGLFDDFVVEFNEQGLDEFKQKMINTWNEIQTAHSIWSSNEETQVFYEYAEIKKQIKELEEQAEKKMEKIKPLLDKVGTMKGDYGTFYTITRKSYEYPLNIEFLEKNYKEAKKEYEQNNEPNKTTITYSYRA